MSDKKAMWELQTAICNGLTKERQSFQSHGLVFEYISFGGSFDVAHGAGKAINAILGFYCFDEHGDASNHEGAVIPPSIELIAYTHGQKGAWVRKPSKEEFALIASYSTNNRRLFRAIV